MFDGLLCISVGQTMIRNMYIRYKLVLESAQEENRDFGDLRQHIFAQPVLVAQASEISGWREYTKRMSVQFPEWQETPRRLT